MVDGRTVDKYEPEATGIRSSEKTLAKGSLLIGSVA
jgi:hypothetical protein